MKNQRDALEILEQAVNLLRSTPLQTLVVYLTGAIPFTLALLFFLSDMTRSPFAAEHLGLASLGLAGLFVWKNVWQGVFVERLYRMLSPGESPRGMVLRVAVIQSSLQPVGLALMLPFPWLVAFFRNVPLFAALGVPEPLRVARRQAMLCTRQNWGILFVTTLGGLLLFGNVLIMITVLPQLARSLLGVEGDFARAGSGIFNSSTIGVAGVLAWLAIDPLLDAAYVLRCFYGESMATGEDLLSALRRAVAAVALLLILLSAGPYPAMAQTPAIDSARLDRSIDEVIHRREFTWRAPRPAGEEPRGRWVGWVRAAEDMIDAAWNWLKDKIHQWFEVKPGAEQDGKGGAVTPRMLQLLIAIAVALLVGAGIFWFRQRRAPVVVAQAVTAAVPAIDLADESLTADQLPESSWLKLAEAWLEKGDCRLALRALHLAGLNYLCERNLVSIRRWKSGLDYQRELERRARGNPQMSPVFDRNVALFERGWYGRHPVDREMVESFVAGLSEMRGYAERI